MGETILSQIHVHVIEEYHHILLSGPLSSYKEAKKQIEVTGWSYVKHEKTVSNLDFRVWFRKKR